MAYTEIDGLRIHYQALGNPAAPKGQRVLYVHGTGCNAQVWQQHMAAIADTHTPVAIDLPGHGQSEGDGFRGVADYSHFVVELASCLGWDRLLWLGTLWAERSRLRSRCTMQICSTGLCSLTQGRGCVCTPAFYKRPARQPKRASVARWLTPEATPAVHLRAWLMLSMP